MPNRILRDWTYSDSVDKISFQAEVLFTRLIMKADDYGSYFAKPKLINGNCFPLKDIRESDISRWLQELVSAGMIVFYTAENKEYLNIIDFNQRLRSMKKRFPQVPDNVIKDHSRAFRQQLDSELTATCPPEVETETEEEEEGEGGKKSPTPDFTIMENLFPEDKKDKASEQVTTGSEKKEKSSAKKEKANPPDLDSFLSVAKEIYQNELKVDFSPYSFAVMAKYNSWIEAGWKDGHKQPIQSWKSKLRNVIPYLKPFNQSSQNGSSQARRR
ncbi:hypothetical protein MP478_04480 [Chryseobacterium sp. WG14]|uniref:hypothetical protein n=1 Tax=Chryseobacterium sp. WG14 TaxID=2926909 RepID=UPI00211DB20D|nr:hypothetical protein [Chryseobacterium sp. WG14]MCQ9638637.1 hypothetical protein [Chryseobacterium sp. WG14]